jgi:alpha-beta hydrolase superfamily lysophospholipase
VRVERVTALDVPVARPRFLAASGRSLFAWHHAPPPHLRRGAGIVLCPALGYEYMSAYRTWRSLAERLSARGFDTLRLDYDGTGNSAGTPEDPDRVEAWLGSIACAIAEARRVSGSNLVALVGLRAGALLAIRAAAAAGGVDRLVLWNPFPSGRAYVRELKALARLSGHDGADAEADEPSINAEGHLVTADTIATLSGWTLDDVTTRPAPDILLVDRDDRPADSTVDDRLTMLGSCVTHIRCAGTAEMLLPPHLSKIPGNTLDEIDTWFGDWRTPPASLSPRPEIDLGDGGTVALHDNLQERAVRFGPGGRLFGMLVCPRDGVSPTSAIVLLNTGAGHNVGPHRLYVPLAREWAARGHLVLRFDLSGIGDSAASPDGTANIAYPYHMLDDAREAIALVRRHAPERPVRVAGLCSGGWLAFLAARLDPPVDAIAAINAPLYLRDGNRQWVSEGRAFERYQQSMRDPSKWVKALRGGASYAAFTRVAASALARRVAVRVSGALGDALPDGLANDLCSIARRRIRSLFVFSRGDNGLAYFQQHAPPALRRAGVRDFVQQLVIEDAGHAFRSRRAQRTLSRLLTEFVAAESRSRG